MKSCLKVTPPYTPLLDSSFGSPSGSRSASPTADSMQLPTLRKRVSFCHDHLEEYFEADDWDRTPAPVAPKLSYQEILELKEIMKSLPRAPSSSSRQPFSSTSIPRSISPPSQSNPPFPISRFAAAPSLTPSKWKNRDDSRSTVDPEILPYLDSVPIRLLPLLPPTQETPISSSPQSASTSSTATLAQLTQPPSASVPRTTLINHPTSITLPTTTTATPLPSPMPTPQQQGPPRRKPNFAFVPLLPVQEEVKVAVEPPILTPSTPTRKFNMNFVPLLLPEEAPKPAISSLPAIRPPTSFSELEPAETTPQAETPPEDDDHHDEFEQEFSPPSSYVPLNFNRSYAPTPSLCSASDTESETPSVSSPCPSSPAESEYIKSHYFDSRLGVVSHGDGYDVASSNYNPYFPPLPISSSMPSHVLSDALAGKRVHLQALPSPALQPPSPFSLNPADDDSTGAEALTPTKGVRRPFIPRPSSLSSLSAAAAQSQEVLDAVSETLGALTVTSTPTLESPAPETPELTIAYMRAAAYARAPDDWTRMAQRGESILEPSIRRREL
ncbi:hypothetical protein PHLGIDRAFT_37440 [Phlebiopsis gigantea 11061_1 CR5-6]|uniref:Uncharacterized protein n=1 Tax=Phlebiopsis gigantea (strain 11061_1 CR5-6) TaxID=745531 RepID=A0A0C3NFG5_PHLG1|nr:hypothetical protein PHLGIDRAFT_37440 [Phlebiopsis gigantea 11061_1 CR5-6]